MTASVFETSLARVAALLLSATAAGARVYRDRDDAFGDDEMPAINIRRGGTEGEVAGQDIELHSLTFSVSCITIGTDWETTADALHMAVHALLMGDATLAANAPRCLGTDVQASSIDRPSGHITILPAGHITSVYQIQIYVNPGDLTVVI